MKVVVRTDASSRIGSGHIMRCKTLANKMLRGGYEVLFVTREHPGNLIHLLECEGLNVVTLAQPPITEILDAKQSDDYASWLGVEQKQDALETAKLSKDFRPNWIIVDHYALDLNWESLIRKYVKNIMVIDDIANRFHDCDILLDQNFNENLIDRYDKLIPKHAVKLLGPKYALLRLEFGEARKKLRHRDGSIKRIMIFFGGVDPTGETEEAMDAVRMKGWPDISVDVVVGASNPRASTIEHKCREMGNASFYQQVSNMAELMSEADLFIGAGGSVTWERLCLGLPGIVKIIAENQRPAMMALAKIGLISLVENKNEDRVIDYLDALNELTAQSLLRMSEAGLSLVDGMGVARVVDVMSGRNNVCQK